MDIRIKRSLIILGSTSLSIAVLSSFAVSAVVLSASTNEEKSETKNVVDLNQALEKNVLFSSEVLNNLKAFSPSLINIGRVRLETSDTEDNNLSYRIISVSPSLKGTGVVAKVLISANPGVNILGETSKLEYDTLVVSSEQLSSEAELENLDSKRAAISKIVSSISDLESNDFVSFLRFNDLTNRALYLEPKFSPPSALAANLNVYEPSLNVSALKKLAPEIIPQLSFRFLRYTNADDQSGTISALFQARNLQQQDLDFNFDFAITFKSSTREKTFAKLILDNRFKNFAKTFPNVAINQSLSVSKDTILPSLVQTQDVALNLNQNYIGISNEDRNALNRAIANLANRNQSLDKKALNNLSKNKLNFEVGYVGSALQNRLLKLVRGELLDASSLKFDRRIWVPFGRDPEILKRLAQALEVEAPESVETLESLNEAINNSSLFVNQSASLGAGKGQLLVQIKVSLGAYSTIFFKRFGPQKGLNALISEEDIIKVLDPESQNSEAQFRVKNDRIQALASLAANSFSDGSEEQTLDVERLSEYFDTPDLISDNPITRKWSHLRYRLLSATLNDQKENEVNAIAAVYLNEQALKDENLLVKINVVLKGFGTRSEIEKNHLRNLVAFYQNNRLITFDNPLLQSSSDPSEVKESNIVIEDIPAEFLSMRPEFAKPKVLGAIEANNTNGFIIVPILFNYKGRDDDQGIKANFRITGFLTEESKLRLNLIAANELFNDKDLVFARTNVQKGELTPNNVNLSDFTLASQFLELIKNDFNDKIEAKILGISNLNLNNGSLEVEIEFKYRDGAANNFNIRPLIRKVTVSSFLRRSQLLLNNAALAFRALNKNFKASEIIAKANYNDLITSFTLDGDSDFNLERINLIISQQEGKRAQANDHSGTLTFTYKVAFNGLVSQNERTITLNNFRTNEEEALDNATVTFKEINTLAPNLNRLPGLITRSFILDNLLKRVVLRAGEADEKVLSHVQNQTNAPENSYALLIDNSIEFDNDLGIVKINFRLQANNIISKTMEHTFSGFKNNETLLLETISTPLITLKPTSSNKDPLNITTDDVTFSGITERNLKSFDFQLISQNHSLATNSEVPFPASKIELNNKPALKISLVIFSKRDPNVRTFKAVVISGFLSQAEIDETRLEDAKSAIALVLGTVANSNKFPNPEWYRRDANGNAPDYATFIAASEAQKLATMNFALKAGLTYKFIMVSKNDANRSLVAKFTITLNDRTLETIPYLLDNFRS